MRQRRQSVSRRSITSITSPGIRSRSQERSMRKFSDFADTDADVLAGLTEFEDSGSFDDDRATIQVQVDSERCQEANQEVSTDRKGHRRAMSDPFDNADEGINDSDLEAILSGNFGEEDDEDGPRLPTLPRYPHLETKDKHCWSEPPVSIFRVRGPNYLKDKKKIESEPYLMRARGIDMFRSKDPFNCIVEKNVMGCLNGTLRKVPTLIVQLTLPWGLQMCYFEVPQHLAKYMAPGNNESLQGLNNAEKTLAKWLAGDDKYKNQRLKLIPYVADGPWVVRQVVTGKPAVIGMKVPVSYRYTPKEGHKESLLVVNLDIGSSSNAVKRIVSLSKRYTSVLTVDLGFVIEGKTKEELPERMMGCVRLHKADPLRCPFV